MRKISLAVLTTAVSAAAFVFANAPQAQVTSEVAAQCEHACTSEADANDAVAVEGQSGELAKSDQQKKANATSNKANAKEEAAKAAKPVNTKEEAAKTPKSNAPVKKK